MKYLICYTLPPHVARYHNDVVADVAMRFGTQLLNQRIPPHVTLKVPFDTRRIEEVEDVVKEFANQYTSAPMQVKGVGTFGQNIIYMDIHASDRARNIVEGFIPFLSHHLPWLPTHRYDHNKNLHATVVKRDAGEQFYAIWKYLTETYDPFFDIEFDNLTILFNERKRWFVHKRFELRSDTVRK
jgi:2'-5' RNA ligase